MSPKTKEIVIPREKAVFWLDASGFWRNAHGKFQRKKIIDHFHASIRRDRGGYHLTQINGAVKEKVYFPYEDTALFAFDVIKGQPVMLELNTGKRVRLKPRKLYIKDDQLYMHLGKERIKFTERSLMQMADFIECRNERYFIRMGNRRYPIAEA